MLRVLISSVVCLCLMLAACGGGSGKSGSRENVNAPGDTSAGLNPSTATLERPPTGTTLPADLIPPR